MLSLRTCNSIGESTEQTVSITFNSPASSMACERNIITTRCATIGTNKLHAQVLARMLLPVYRHRIISMSTGNIMPSLCRTLEGFLWQRFAFFILTLKLPSLCRGNSNFLWRRFAFFHLQARVSCYLQSLVLETCSPEPEGTWPLPWFSLSWGREEPCSDCHSSYVSVHAQCLSSPRALTTVACLGGRSLSADLLPSSSCHSP